MVSEHRPGAPIVVGVDASPESLAALEWAVRLAVALGSRLVVVHAAGLLEEGGYRERPDVAAIVDAARRRVSGGEDAPIAVIVEDGPAADVVVRVAQREDAELIVVGSRGVGQAPRLLGSVSEAVLAHAHVAVLVVPHGE
jgi:nucleotide-binding universal stress UspA family protein